MAGLQRHAEAGSRASEWRQPWDRRVGGWARSLNDSDGGCPEVALAFDGHQPMLARCNRSEGREGGVSVERGHSMLKATHDR